MQNQANPTDEVMVRRLFESETTREMDVIQAEINACFDTNSSIDPVKIKRLQELRLLRLTDLVSTHDRRVQMMKTKALELISKMPHFTSEQLKLNAGACERLQIEQERFDVAAKHWAISEECLWEESEAYSIAAGILILANEIC